MLSSHISSDSVLPLRSQTLQAVPGIVHGFSTRMGGVSTAYRSPSEDGGDLNLGYTAHDSADNVRRNRALWQRTLGIPEGAFRFGLLRQEHTADIRIVRTRMDAAAELIVPGTERADGFITDLPEVLLTIQTADCIPVLLCDPVRHVLGAFHAGWRGTLARIVELGIGAMRQNYGTEPDDIFAAVGPGIGPASFIVGGDVERQFAAEFEYSQGLFTPMAGMSSVRLNLWEANLQQLLHCGVASTKIDILAEDTAADTRRFFSYRAEHGRTGRMMSSIGWQF